MTPSGRGATFFHVDGSTKPMAKKNIYIHDSIYEKISAEADRRGISFSHACSLAFTAWLDSLRQIKVNLDKHYGSTEKDPSEMR